MRKIYINFKKKLFDCKRIFEKISAEFAANYQKKWKKQRGNFKINLKTHCEKRKKNLGKNELNCENLKKILERFTYISIKLWHEQK